MLGESFLYSHLAHMGCISHFSVAHFTPTIKAGAKMVELDTGFIVSSQGEELRHQHRVLFVCCFHDDTLHTVSQQLCLSACVPLLLCPNTHAVGGGGVGTAVGCNNIHL